MQVNHETIKNLAEDRGLTVTGLARIARVEPSVMSAIRRRGTCHPSTTRKLADALGVSVAHLADRGEK